MVHHNPIYYHTLAIELDMIFIPFASTKAQIHKDVFSTTLENCWEIDCVGEILCGEIDFVMTTWTYDLQLKKRQLKYCGTLAGQTSGEIYTVREVENAHGFSSKKELIT